MKKTVLIVTVLAIVACSTGVWSQGRHGAGRHGGPGGPGGHGGPGMMMSCPAMAAAPPHTFMFDGANKALNLTSAQKARIDQITAKSDAAQRTLTKKAADASKAFRAALMAEKYDVKNVKRLAAAAEKAESAVVNARIDEWTQLRSVLTARQISECDKMMGRGGPDHQPGGRGGPR